VPIITEFCHPSTEFVLGRALQEAPDVTAERIVADTTNRVMPFFWASCGGIDVFDHALGTDPSVDDVRRLDEGEEGRFYRAAASSPSCSSGFPFLALRTVSPSVRVSAVRPVALVVRTTGSGGECDRSERRDQHVSEGGEAYGQLRRGDTRVPGPLAPTGGTAERNSTFVVFRRVWPAVF